MSGQVRSRSRCRKEDSSAKIAEAGLVRICRLKAIYALRPHEQSSSDQCLNVKLVVVFRKAFILVAGQQCYNSAMQAESSCFFHRVHRRSPEVLV